MTLEELRDYVDEQRTLNNIPYHVYSALIDGIDTLEQEPKTGHWKPTIVRGSESYICSECLAECCYATTNYCPNCGCAMVELQESEDKSCDNCKWNKTDKCQPSTCAMIGCDGHGLWETIESEG